MSTSSGESERDSETVYVKQLRTADVYHTTKDCPSAQRAETLREVRLDWLNTVRPDIEECSREPCGGTITRRAPDHSTYRLARSIGRDETRERDD